MPQYPPFGRGNKGRLSRDQTVRALLVGGFMYDGLYERVAAFERETGLRVEASTAFPTPS